MGVENGAAEHKRLTTTSIVGFRVSRAYHRDPRKNRFNSMVLPENEREVMGLKQRKVQPQRAPESFA